MRRLFALFLVLLTPTGISSLSASEFLGVSNERPVRLEIGKGALLRLDQPAQTVFVADPKIANIQVKSPRLIYLVALKPGETSLYAVDSNERVLFSRRITVSHNVSRLKRALQSLLPDSLVDVRSVDGTLVLSGFVNSAKESEDARRMARKLVAKDTDILNKIDVIAPNQVNLRVQVAEVSRDVLKEFGINFEGMLSSGDIFYGLGFQRDFISDIGTIPRTQTNSAVLGIDRGSQSFAGLIDALEEQGLITILAEPNLTAVSGEPASFLAGGEFPILVPSDDKTVIEFKQFGVSLSFTPTLIGDRRISLKVSPEVSQLSTEGAVDFAGFTIPSLTTRRANTTVELNSGQSFAIAGLIQNNITHNLNKVPGLADIPILGALFRSDRFRRDESELVIVVTPYIVRPVSGQRLALPTDGLVPPTDVDRVVRGRMYRPSLNRRRHGPNGRGAAGITGPVGFELN